MNLTVKNFDNQVAFKLALRKHLTSLKVKSVKLNGVLFEKNEKESILITHNRKQKTEEVIFTELIIGKKVIRKILQSFI